MAAALESKSDDGCKAPIRVMISGAAGQIGYSLIPLFTNGLVFGPDQPLILHLLEIAPALKALNGVAMEIKDGAYPLIQQVICTADASVGFKDIDYAILVGGFPRKKGMLRKDLLAKNAPIFKSMGEGLEKYAKTTTKVLVVANPANTNCLTCATHAPKIPNRNFSAMTRLDMNRARAQLSEKLGVGVSDVQNVVIWGNHSATQVPDIENALVKRVGGSLAPVVSLVDAKWVRDDFTKLVQQRGKAIIEARGFSSAVSAANAAKDTIRDLVNGTNPGEHVAMSVFTEKGNEYGIAPGLYFSMPVVCKNGDYSVVNGLFLNDEVKKLIKESEKELMEERKEAGMKWDGEKVVFI